ncbi:MAG: carboxypeptidase regulatory-like domain-containing protein, partial [Hamadaea sp.]|nr:carboxypeptidase regulatory-like domain-containing protein [Hamadaea sp.]
MTVATHRRRAFLLRAGVVASLALGSILAIGAPAHAGVKSVTLNPGSITIDAGSDEAVTIEVDADALDAGDKQVVVTSLPTGVSASNCDKVSINPSGKGTCTLKVAAASNAPSISNDSVSISVDGVQPAQPLKVTVKGAVQTVNQVSGSIKDASTGEKMSGVLVVMADGAGKTRTDETDGSGSFSFTGSASNPIVPGTIRIAVSKDGFTNPSTKSYSISAGGSKTDISIAMTPKGASA